MRRICIIGNANLDLVMGPLAEWPEAGTEAFLPRADLRIGGSAANTALVLQRLDADVGLISGTGAGEDGAAIRTTFTGPLDRLKDFDAPTGVSVGVLHPGAERTFLSFAGHLDRIDLDVLASGLEDWPLDGALALVSGGFALPALMKDHARLLDRLRDGGAEVAIDPGWPGGGWTGEALRFAREWMARADHVLLNDKEATGLAGTGDLELAIERLVPTLARGARLIVKRGRKGALAVWAGGRAEADAEPLEVFDTVGAGDAFNAGYLSALAEGATIAAALSRGTEVAGRVISEFPRSRRPLARETG